MQVNWRHSRTGGQPAAWDSATSIHAAHGVFDEVYMHSASTPVDSGKCAVLDMHLLVGVWSFLTVVLQQLCQTACHAL